MSSPKKSLPIGVQSFKKLIEENFIYIDKTKYISDLTSTGLYYFLSRPRRFGKTLLCTTLEQLFKGNRKLFHSLAIDSTNYSWEEYPVISISFATMAPKSATVLSAAIEKTLRNIAKNYGVEIDKDEPTLGMKFKSLIMSLAKKNRVVILVDEYDAAILRNIDNFNVANECREVLSDFFSALKDGKVDEYLRFVFITGITKFSKTSIFSGVNNLQDLSLDPRAAHLLGYTADEIEANYQDYLSEIVQKTGQKKKEILEHVRFWYNGYQFADFEAIETQKVYNPYSVMLYLQNKVFDNYWFDTGTPTFLMELLKKQDYPITSIEGAKIHKSKTKTYAIDKIKLIPLLWQAGYLTIKSYNPTTKNYTLTFPNEEVRVSFFENVMENLTDVDTALLSSFVSKLSQSIQKPDLKTFFETLKVFFAQIPYDMHIPLERYYQSIFFSIMTLLGSHVICEDRTHNGRIDAVIETDNQIFIFEFKIDKSAQIALDQITTKRYYQKYLLKEKPIILVGIQFDTQDKNISDWIAQELIKRD